MCVPYSPGSAAYIFNIFVRAPVAIALLCGCLDGLLWCGTRILTMIPHCVQASPDLPQCISDAHKWPWTGFFPDVALSTIWGVRSHTLDLKEGSNIHLGIPVIIAKPWGTVGDYKLSCLSMSFPRTA